VKVLTNYAEFRHILDRVPDAKFILDCGHANVGNVNPFEGFEEFSHRIVAMSLSQNDGDRDDHLPLSKGNIIYSDLLALIEKSKWQGIIAFETRGRDPMKSLEDLRAMYLSYSLAPLDC
jgi:L-ribulose-5-phosphate 3-epimerase